MWLETMWLCNPMGNLCKLLKLILVLSPVTIATIPYLNTVSVFTLMHKEIFTLSFLVNYIVCGSSHFMTSYRVPHGYITSYWFCFHQLPHTKNYYYFFFGIIEIVGKIFINSCISKHNVEDCQIRQYLKNYRTDTNIAKLKQSINGNLIQHKGSPKLKPSTIVFLTTCFQDCVYK